MRGSRRARTTVWTPLAATKANPFARADDVTFPSGGDHNRLPWRLGLLTRTNSNC